MKIAFFWTAEFSRNILKSILENHKEVEVWLVVSQPDKPVWRKKIITETPLKKLAIENNIKVLQPEKLKWNTEFFDELKGFDFIIVVAYWKIVPIEVLEAWKYGCINIHGSILPKYRWASPIQESIKNWDKETWLTIMYMSEWMDEWDILAIEKVNIDKLDKTLDIFKKFEKIWPKILVNTLNKIVDWNIISTKQVDSEATYCSKISKLDWEVNFKNDNIIDIYNKFKAYSPWPWIYSYYNNKKFTIEDCELSELLFTEDKELTPWDVIKIKNEHWAKNTKIWILWNWWTLILKQVKLEWKKSMDILSFVNWNKDFLEYTF